MKAWRRFLVHILVVLLPAPFVDAHSKYPKTIYALQQRYLDEIIGVHTYLASAQKALSENYPSIVYLFVAFPAFEAVHARNFEKLLTELRVQVKEIPTPELRVSTTKNNLNHAATVEIEEIDDEYPRLIQYIKPEKDGAAIQNILYAWRAEERNRGLLKKVLSGAGVFF